MKRLKLINLSLGTLLLYVITTSVPASAELKTYKGYWVYGFEQSIFESCDGARYWMWAPDQFTGQYSTEGFRNYVKVTGYPKPADPENNMYSTLPSLEVREIEHADVEC